MNINYEYLNFQARALNETPGTLNLLDGYNCEQCKNKGLTYFIRGDEVASRLCECRGKRKAIREINNMTQGKELTMEKFIATENHQAVMKKGAEDFLKSNKKAWFFVGGQSGSGKTHLCTAVCYKLIERAQGVAIMHWVDKLREIKEAIKSGGYIDEIKKYKRCDVLYIDDLFKGAGCESISEADIKIAFEIINSRYSDNDKITIISSEYVLDEIVRIDEAIGSRIKERAKNFVFNIGRDMRKNYRM